MEFNIRETIVSLSESSIISTLSYRLVQMREALL